MPKKLTFKPNYTYNLGVGAYLFGIGYQFTVGLPQTDSKMDARGKSKGLSLQLSFKGNHWGVDVYTSNNRGFYKTDNTVADGSAFQRQDVRTRITGISGIYLFNKITYSMRAPDSYYERQLKSAGSILIRGNLSRFSLRADSSIYNQSTVVTGSDTDFQRINYTTLSIAPGYAYNFVFRKSFFASALISFGPAINRFSFNSGTSSWMSASELNTFSDVRFAAGYNGKRFFTGITFIRQTTHINYHKTNFTNTTDAMKISIGYRFHEVGVLRRRASDILKPKGR